MNFDVDYRHVHTVRSPQAVPLLVLVKEWASHGQEAFALSDVILLILRAIQPLANFKHGLGVQQILDGLDHPGLKVKFLKSFEQVLGNIMPFINLFDSLSGLLNQTDKSSLRMLDVDCSNSIIGIYVRQCVLEFNKLTFTQLSRFHANLKEYFRIDEEGAYTELETSVYENFFKEEADEFSNLDFVSQLRRLIMWGDSGISGDITTLPPGPAPSSSAVSSSSAGNPSCRVELGSEALRLAELHGKFGHNKDGLYALEEAIRLAQQSDNTTLLEHALAWLLKMEAFDLKNCHSMLKRFVKNAEDLKMPSLGLWGRLQQAKTQILLSEPPKTVLQNLLTSEVEYLSCYDNEEGCWKAALRSSTLSLLATAWEHYGNRLQALHYAQLVCHMTSCDHLPQSPEEQESIALALTIVAKHLHQNGDGSKALLLLKCSISKFRNTGLPFKILCKCEAEVLFEEAVRRKEAGLAEEHLTALHFTTNAEKRYRSAVLARCKGHLSQAVNILNSILSQAKGSSTSDLPPELLSSCWNLLAEVNLDLCLPSRALDNAVENLAFSKRHHLSTLRPALTISSTLLQLGRVEECAEILQQHSLQVLLNGTLEDRGVMHFLKAQSLLFKNKASLTKEAVDPVLSLLKLACSHFESVSALSALQDSQTLQASLQNFIDTALQ